MVDATDDVIRVASSTPTATLSGAIINALGERESVTLRAVGAGAVNQATKACAALQTHLAQQGRRLYTVPTFCNVTMGDGQTLSGIMFRVEIKQI